MRHWRPDTVAATATGAAAFVVYVLLRGREVGAWDTAEMQTVPYVFGIAHRPAYPLFTMLSGVWAELPIGAPVERMNLFSALLFSVAAALVVLLSCRLGVRRPLAVIGGLVFAYGSGAIVNATQIDVQSLHVALMAGVLLAAHRTLDHPTRRNLMITAVLVGCGMAHHGLMILTGPVILVLVVLGRRQALLRPDVVSPAVAATVVPLVAYAYPVLTVDTSRLVNSDYSSGWLDVFLARGGVTGSLGTTSSIGVWFRAIDDQLGVLAGWMSTVPLVLAVIGLAILLMRSTAFGLVVTVTIVIASYTQANATDILDRYLLTVALCVAVTMAVATHHALDLALARLPRSASPQIVVVGVAVVAVIPTLLGATALADGRTDTDIHRLNAERVLAALPERCVLWAYWDIRTTLTHLHVIEGVRPDITILDHRSATMVGSSYAASPAGVYEGVRRDPDLSGRPVCHIAYPSPTGVPAGLEMVPLVRTITPWGRDELLAEQTVHLVRPVD